MLKNVLSVEKKLSTWMSSKVKSVPNNIKNTSSVNLKIECMKTYANAFLFEPCSNVGTNLGSYRYISGGPPKKLSHCIKEFATRTKTKVDTTQQLAICSASMEGEGHVFLIGFDHFKCSICNRTICYHCAQVLKSIAEKSYYAVIAIVQVCVIQLTVKTQDQMRSELLNNGWAIHSNTISNVETLD